jgi:hypothetical protein
MDTNQEGLMRSIGPVHVWQLDGETDCVVVTQDNEEEVSRRLSPEAAQAFADGYNAALVQVGALVFDQVRTPSAQPPLEF